MDEQRVFASLGKQKKAALLEYLRAAWEQMDDDQRRNVFAGAMPALPKVRVDGDKLWQEIEQFRRDSRARKYYAPFNINSKNWTDIPRQTREWCDQFARLVEQTSELSARGEHAQAVRCFAVLYELLRAMEGGDQEIIFGDEIGNWLIHTDEKVWLKAYLTSLAATRGPEEFAEAVGPILFRDSIHSFASRVYQSACAVANAKQKACLKETMRRQNIETGPRS